MARFPAIGFSAGSAESLSSRRTLILSSWHRAEQIYYGQSGGSYRKFQYAPYTQDSYYRATNVTGDPQVLSYEYTGQNTRLDDYDYSCTTLTSREEWRQYADLYAPYYPTHSVGSSSTFPAEALSPSYSVSAPTPEYNFSNTACKLECQCYPSLPIPLASQQTSPISPVAVITSINSSGSSLPSNSQTRQLCEPDSSWTDSCDPPAEYTGSVYHEPVTAPSQPVFASPSVDICSPDDTFQTPCQLLASLLQPDPTLVPDVSFSRAAEPIKEREEIKRNETLRQARMRSIAEFIGFEPTDPDTLSCHDKKRGYLECLEEYVVWLREQCHLAHIDSGKIERLPKYTGVSNRSLRTMIVHTENILRRDHEETLREEVEFLTLRGQVVRLEAEQAEGRRSEIAEA